MTDKVFGNKTEFGIRYVPGWKAKDSNLYFAKLHLLLDGQLIGNKNETSLVGTWMHSIQNILNLLTQDFEKLYHDEFENRTDAEIFELIYKANQLEEEFDSKFLHLPVLKNEIWVNCNINLDETIDAFLLSIIVKDEKIKFIWKGWRAPCPRQRIGKLYSIASKREQVIQTISECLEFVKKDLTNYKTKTTI
ncbi:MAG: Imm42 family immunity protein [Saprospiraceae bacterium]